MRRKVFKLAKTRIGAGEHLSLAKAHRLSGDATTYHLHPGRHEIELLVNGTSLARSEFDLVGP